MLPPQESDRVVESIRSAEKSTSAEIRVCIARKCKCDPLEAALKKFRQLRMEETALRNAVLIYVAPDSHKAAILGDAGISKIAGAGFWDEVLEEMISLFKDGDICGGICRGVEKAGELMKNCFPVSESDVNELNNDVVWDEE